MKKILFLLWLLSGSVYAQLISPGVGGSSSSTVTTNSGSGGSSTNQYTVVNLRSDFGALGNSNNDDSVALQAAFAYVTSANPTNKLQIYAPAGNYLIKSTIAGVFSNIVFMGDGLNTKFFVTNAVSFLYASNNSYNITFDSVWLDGPGKWTNGMASPLGVDCIDLEGTNRIFHAYRSRFTSWPHFAILAGMGAGVPVTYNTKASGNFFSDIGYGVNERPGMATNAADGGCLAVMGGDFEFNYNFCTNLYAKCMEIGSFAGGQEARIGEVKGNTIIDWRQQAICFVNNSTGTNFADIVIDGNHCYVLSLTNGAPLAEQPPTDGIDLNVSGYSANDISGITCVNNYGWANPNACQNVSISFTYFIGSSGQFKNSSVKNNKAEGYWGKGYSTNVNDLANQLLWENNFSMLKPSVCTPVGQTNVLNIVPPPVPGVVTNGGTATDITLNRVTITGNGNTNTAPFVSINNGSFDMQAPFTLRHHDIKPITWWAGGVWGTAAMSNAVWGIAQGTSNSFGSGTANANTAFGGMGSIKTFIMTNLEAGATSGGTAILDSGTTTKSVFSDTGTRYLPLISPCVVSVQEVSSGGAGAATTNTFKILYAFSTAATNIPSPAFNTSYPNPFPMFSTFNAKVLESPSLNNPAHLRATVWYPYGVTNSPNDFSLPGVAGVAGDFTNNISVRVPVGGGVIVTNIGGATVTFIRAEFTP